MPAPTNRRTLALALLLAGTGIAVFPCKRNSKMPATEHGFKDATTDEAQIRAWFDNDRGLNLAVATGWQADAGYFLFAVDIDPKHGGDRTWAALIALHGTPMAPRHTTPSGGFHLFFAAPPGLTISRNGLGEGIDTRGEGGYVVVPPSQLVDDNGEIIHYQTSRELALATNKPGPLPEWIIAELASANQVTASIARHPSQHHNGDDGPYDRARQGWRWEDELAADGWVVHSRSGGDVRFTRPGKSPRDGHSATLHPSGSFVVFTTDRPFGGKATNGADGATFSPGEYIQHYRLGGDFKALMRMFPPDDVGRWRSGSPPPDWAVPSGRASDTATEPTVPLHPDPEWYTQRPWLAACQQMAQSSGGSPAAHMLAFLTRWATLIPPGYTIPAINGAPSSFDLLGVVAGTSGSGKTSALINAEHMIPTPEMSALRMGLGLGSGEGIIEAFYGMRDVHDDESGKVTKVRDRAIAGVNFSISEGLIFSDLADRGGTTHVTRFCDAWSGATLSVANAKTDTFRHIERGQYRLTMMMGIQADMADQLITDKAASQGFVGRLLFVWAEEPRVRPRPKPPALLDLAVPKTVAYPATKERWKLFQTTYLDYDPAIWTECQELADARVGQDVPVEDHHHDLLRCKVAGVLALMEGRQNVDLDDWRIATDIVTISSCIRKHLRRICSQSRGVTQVTAAEVRGDLKAVEALSSERRLVATLSARLVERTPRDGWTVRQAERILTSSDTRHRLDPALTLAIHNGYLAVIDERIVHQAGKRGSFPG